MWHKYTRWFTHYQCVCFLMLFMIARLVEYTIIISRPISIEYWKTIKHPLQYRICLFPISCIQTKVCPTSNTIILCFRVTNYASSSFIWTAFVFSIHLNRKASACMPTICYLLMYIPITDLFLNFRWCVVSLWCCKGHHLSFNTINLPSSLPYRTLSLWLTIWLLRSNFLF